MKDVQNLQCLRIGFIVNSYAGIGGAAALKGSDGMEVREQALAFSQSLRAPQRVQRFLQALPAATSIEWCTGAGLLGEDYLLEQGIFPRQVLGEKKQTTTAQDTRMLAQQLVVLGVDLIVFVGGDGTARDVLDSVGTAIPCLGLPSGVKMQSGVFALSPEAAAEIVQGLMSTHLMTVSEQDVRDIDEQALREGRVRSQYYGSMRVPAAPLYLQHLKQSGVEDETLVLNDIAEHLSEIMHDGFVMLVGPGRTLAYWMETIGLPNTLVGFDAVCDGKIIKSDLNAEDVLELQRQYPDVLLLLSPTGQQGMLIGRGNQQLSPDFLKALPRAQWCIVASKNKLAAFQGKPLIVDSNDFDLDKKLCGLYNIITAYHHQVLYPVNITYKI